MGLSSPGASTPRSSRAAAAYKGTNDVTSPQRAVVMLYERMLRDLDDATAAIAAKDPARAHECLVHAQQILEGLDLCLDQTVWSGAASLSSIYQYADELLVKANIKKDPAPIAECRALLAPLADAWKSAWNQLQSGTPAGTSA